MNYISEKHTTFALLLDATESELDIGSFLISLILPIHLNRLATIVNRFTC